MTNWRVFCALLGRECALIRARGYQGILPGSFFLAAIAVIALSAHPAGFSASSPAQASLAALWIAVLLTALIAIEPVYAEDERAGIADLLAGLPNSGVGWLAAKLVLHWAMTGLPVVVLSPIAAFWLAVPEKDLAEFASALAIGSAIFTLISCFAAAIASQARRAGALMVLVSMPLAVPAIILAQLEDKSLLIADFLTSIVLFPPLALYALRANACD